MRPALLFLLALCLLAGCASPQAVKPDASAYMVSANTGFFRYGPAQGTGADLSLTVGQRITLLARSSGYSKIRLETGDTGYVSTDDIAPAPPPEPTPTPFPDLPRASYREDYSTDLPQPSFDLPAELPPLEDPSPAFRY